MISLDAVSARGLAGMSIAWGPGVHAAIGAREDGCGALLAVVAGELRPSAGSVRVLDRSPSQVRDRIGVVAMAPPLPEALRVEELLAVAASIRGEPGRDARQRLAVAGVEALARRAVRSLSREEARAVAFAEAVSSARVGVLLVEEPFVKMDGRAASRMAGVLRARAREGCVVVVATASTRDAAELADDYVLLRAGAIAGRASTLDDLAEFSPAGARVRIVVGDAASDLAARLARCEAVEGVERAQGAVIARGADAHALAGAVQRALVECGATPIEIRPAPPPLEDARSAAAGIAAATFEVARTRTLAALVSQRTPAAPPAPSASSSEEPT